MKLSNSLVLPAIIILVGCSTAATSPRPLPVPPQRITLDGYSLLPPNEPGWMSAPVSPGKLALGKRGDAPDQTTTIQANSISIEPYKTTEEFINSINRFHMAKLPPDRMKVLKYEAELDRSRPEKCVITDIAVEDTQAVKRSAPVKGSMIMAIHTLTCVLPGKSSAGFSVAYSQRYYPENIDPDFMKKAESVTSSVTILSP